MEDEAIEAAVRMQEDVGLRSVTDGEFRRSSWHMDFIYRLDGVEKAPGDLTIQFRNAEGTIEFTPAAMQVVGRLGVTETIFGEDFAMLRSCVTGATPKLTIPSPSMVHFRGGRAAVNPDVYPDMDAFWADLTTAYAEEVRRLGELGCTYLQFDDTSLAYLNDPQQREYVAGIGGDPDRQHVAYIRHINEALAGRPEGMAVTTHLCRGNFRSSWAAEGGYDFVAEALFGESRGGRLLPRVRRRALGQLRAAAVRAEGKAGGARARDDEERGARVQGRAEAAHRGGEPLRPARAALPVAAMRLLVDRRRERADVRRAGRQAPPRRRDRAGDLGIALRRSQGERLCAISPGHMSQIASTSHLLDEEYGAGVDPPYLWPDYVGTRLRAPQERLVVLPHTLSELTGPVYGESAVRPTDSDLTRQHAGEPVGERIVVAGRVLDGDGRPIRGQLIEIWQANAAGRYRHSTDAHSAPLDPNFSGGGRCLTGDDGSYRFVTVKPGAYPWPNHPNAWRPNHIHFSLFGRAFTERLVTQMYFPGDPLFDFDPIFNSIRDERARERLVCRFDIDLTEPDWALGFRFDIVLGGRLPTPLEEPHDD